MLRTFGVRDCQLLSIEEKWPIRQTGHRVMIRKKVTALIFLLARSDVMLDGDEVSDDSIFIK